MSKINSAFRAEQLAEAARLGLRGIRRYPQSVELHIKLIAAMARQGMAGEAARRLLLVPHIAESGDVPLDELFAWAGYVGSSLAGQGLRQAELELYAAISIQYPTEAWPYFAQARALRDSEPAAAEPLLRLAIKHDPACSGYKSNLAYVLSDLGRDEEAVDLYRTILSTEPDELVTLYNLGCLYKELGRELDAASCFHKLADAVVPTRNAELVLAADVLFPLACLELGLHYWRMNDVARASGYVHRAVGFALPDAESASNIINVLEQAGWPEASARLREILGIAASE